MDKHVRLLQRILSADADASIRFTDLIRLLSRLGFSQRIQDDRLIITKAGIDEIVSLRAKGGMAKSYQVRQLRGIILKYRLEIREDD